MVGLQGSCEDAWQTLMGSAGLGTSEIREAGASYNARTGAGVELAGDILLVDPPYRLLVTVEGMNKALLGVTIEQMGPQNFLYLSLSTYGLDKGTVEDIGTRWQAWLSELFPAAGDPAKAFQQ
jgi:hypothetical protein